MYARRGPGAFGDESIWERVVVGQLLSKDQIARGARVINLSSALVRPSPKGESKLNEAFNHAAQRGVITVAAAGNQGAVGSSAITRHPWVIPVAACDTQGRPLNESNLGSSIGRRGLGGPGDIGSVLAPPKAEGGSSAGAGIVVSSQPGSKVGIPGTGGKGSLAMSPSGGDKGMLPKRVVENAERLKSILKQ